MGYTTNPDKGIVPAHVKQNIMKLGSGDIKPFKLSFANEKDKNKMYHAIRAYLRGVDSTLPPSERIAHIIFISRPPKQLYIQRKTFGSMTMEEGE